MQKMKEINIKDKEYPKQLLKIKNPPKKLYVMGNEKLLKHKSIAIVGSRHCSEYGVKYATKFAKELSKSGICIVSGLAIGIDTAAHNGSKLYQGKTIAVLGSGFYNIYPKENINLFNEIINLKGCIISEYPPETKPDLRKFPKRNRIISGLSEGVLVVEALYRSGSTITAKYGYEQGKKVFCIPSNLGVKTGVGTNKLIQNGAKLVLKSSEILETLGVSSVSNMEYLEEEIDIEKEFRKIYKVLEEGALNINIIAKKTNEKISEVSQKLSLMEVYGYVKSLPGNEYERR